MNKTVDQLIYLIKQNDGINDKGKLAEIVMKQFQLIRDRSVFFNKDFAIRFSSSVKQTFGNTVLSLSNLRKIDDLPFIVCLVTPDINYIFLSNSTFLKKISHSSHTLRENNIRGSFNGSDIIRVFEGVTNVPENFEWLFNIHIGLGFDGNLARLVETTNNISPTGRKFEPDQIEMQRILMSPVRALQFIESQDVLTLKTELDDKVNKFKNEILLAALIENVNVRGRIIEYLIAGEDDRLREEIIIALKNRTHGIPQFKTDNALGDYTKEFQHFLTQTDVKTKIMILDSNPKAYNLDKMLEFLASEHSVFMFYFIGVLPEKIVNTVLVSIFQEKILNATILLRHWAGRNSRGVSQFEGKAISQLILSPESAINVEKANGFLQVVLAL